MALERMGIIITLRQRIIKIANGLIESGDGEQYQQIPRNFAAVR